MRVARSGADLLKFFWASEIFEMMLNLSICLRVWVVLKLLSVGPALIP